MHIDFVFFRNPDTDEFKFINVEDETGTEISPGQWVKRPDGYEAIRLQISEKMIDAAEELQASQRTSQ